MGILLLIPNFSVSQPYGDGIDLRLKWVKVERSCIGEGELIKIKARVENCGTGNATIPPFTVSFYHDEINELNLIERKHYDSINVYRLPSVYWDTKGFTGECAIIAHVDIDDENNSNNDAVTSIKIFDTMPDEYEKKITITEIYYYARPNKNNEYVCIHNPTSKKIHLYGWYLTKDPWKRVDKQTKVIFPNMFMNENQTICITQNASSFFAEIGEVPDFEYYDCSSTPNLERKGSFILSNEGGVVCLKDLYNHTIDTVVYGNKNFSGGWEGKSINAVGAGEIMKRKYNGKFIDTNSSNDWEYNRTYRIGQSDFSPFRIQFRGNVTLFSSPDNSFDTISSEIERAKKSICLNIYEFTSPQLYYSLHRVLDKNVSIKLLLEGHPAGGLSMEERYIASKISEAGGKLFYMVGDESEGKYRRYTFDHAKYAIIDNETSIIQSANWGKTGVPASNTFGNREWGVVVRNESLANFLLDVLKEDTDYAEDIIPFNPSDFRYGNPYPDFVMNEGTPEGNYHPTFSPETINGTFNCTVILSPDNAEGKICRLINSARKSILVEQLYIQKNWDGLNPFLREIVNKSDEDIKVRVIMNYNPSYESTNEMNEETMKYLKQNDIDVKFVYSNWSYFSNMHNKGMIVDGNKTLVSSINWNENSVRNNREVGIIIENEDVGKYFTKIFNYDWNLSGYEEEDEMSETNYVNALAVTAVFAIAFLLLYFHWRRK